MPRISIGPLSVLLMSTVLFMPVAAEGQTQAPPPTEPVTVNGKAVLATPHLTGIRETLTGKVPECLKANTAYAVSGKHLNAEQLDRSIHIGGHGVGFALKVHQWSDTRVTVSIAPRSFSLVSPDKGYYMAVKEGLLWASDLSLRWRPCAPPE